MCKNICISVFLLLLGFNAMAQNCLPASIRLSCMESNDYCIPDPSVTNGYGNDAWYASHNLHTCLGSQPNSSWIMFQISKPGDILIYIQQFREYDTLNCCPNPQSVALDIDFACWGPFTNVTDGNDFLTKLCNNVFNLSSSNLGSHRPTNGNHNGDTGGYPYNTNPNDSNSIALTDCSYHSAGTEWCFIPNAQSDDWYLLLLTNYSNQPGYFSFTTLHTAASGSSDYQGSTNCEKLNCLATSNGDPCEGDEITIYCTLSQSELPNNVQYQWIAPNGTILATTPDSSYSFIADPNMSGQFGVLLLGTNPTQHGYAEVNVHTAPAVIYASATTIHLGDTIMLYTPYSPEYDPDSTDNNGYCKWYLNNTDGAPIGTETSLLVHPTENCQYILQVKNGYYDCTNADSVSILVLPVNPEDTTGIRDYSTEKIVRIYPNPTKEMVTIQLVSSDFLSEEIVLQLFDKTGRQLQSWKMTENTSELNLSSYASGTYLLKVMNKKQVMDVRKIIKQ